MAFDLADDDLFSDSNGDDSDGDDDDGDDNDGDDQHEDYDIRGVGWAFGVAVHAAMRGTIVELPKPMTPIEQAWLNSVSLDDFAMSGVWTT